MRTCLYCGAELTSRTARFCPGHHRPYRTNLIKDWMRNRTNEEARREIERKLQRFPGWWDYENEQPVFTGQHQNSDRSIQRRTTMAPAHVNVPVQYHFRKFGIELETSSPSESVLSKAIALIQANHVNMRTTNYNHTDVSYWKVLTDGSLSGGYCREIVSPAFDSEAGLQEVTKVATILNTMGVKVNNTCGFHVHLDASDLTPKQISTVCRFYQAYEREIDKLHQGTRRGNPGYTHTLQNRRFPENPTSLDSVRSAFGHDRYFKVNVEAYLRHGTLEFRQHGATIDPVKVAYWIKFCTRIIDFAKSGNEINTNVNLFDALNLDHDERLYWEYRMAVLAS